MSGVTNRVSLDTDTVLLRNIYAFQPSTHIPITANQVLATGSHGSAIFQNPLKPLQAALLESDVFDTSGWLPSTFSSIYGKLNGLNAPVTQAQFSSLSDNVSTIKTSLQTSIDTISVNLETLSTATAQQFANFSTISGAALIITTLDSHISTLSSNVYTDLSALSTGIRSYIATNPVGAVLSSTFAAFSTKTVADISALSTRFTNNSTSMISLTGYVDNRFSTLSGLVNFFYTSHVSVTFCTFSSLVFSVINDLSRDTFSTISGTSNYIYQNPRFDVAGQFSGSLAVNTPLSMTIPVGTSFAVNSGNAMNILDSFGNNNVGIKTTIPRTDLDVSGTVKAAVFMTRATPIAGILPAAALTTTATAAQIRTGLADSSANLTAAGSLQITNASGSFAAFTVDVSAAKTTINTATDISGRARFYYDTVLQSHANATPTMYVDNSAAKVYVGSGVRTDLSVNTIFNVSGESYLPKIFVNPNPTNQTVYITSNDGTLAGPSANHYAIFGWGNAFVDEIPRYLSFRAGGDRNVMVLDDTGAVGINKETTYADISAFKLALDVSGSARITQGLYSSTNRFDLITNKQQGLYIDASTNAGYITVAARDFSANSILPLLCDSSFSISRAVAIGQRGTTTYMLDVSGSTRIGGSTIMDGRVGIGITSPQYPLDVSGDVRIAGKMTVTNSVQLNNTLGVSGDILGLSKLTIGGVTQLNNTLGVSGNVNVSGNMHITGSLSSSGEITFDSTSANIKGSLTISGDISGFSNLNIRGTTYLNNTLGVSGDIYGLSKLTIGGVTQLNNTLGVSGNVNISGGLLVNGLFKSNKNVYIVTTDSTYPSYSINVSGDYANSYIVISGNVITITIENKNAYYEFYNATTNVVRIQTLPGPTRITSIAPNQYKPVYYNTINRTSYLDYNSKQSVTCEYSSASPYNFSLQGIWSDSNYIIIINDISNASTPKTLTINPNNSGVSYTLYIQNIINDINVIYNINTIFTLTPLHIGCTINIYSVIINSIETYEYTVLDGNNRNEFVSVQPGSVSSPSIRFSGSSTGIYQDTSGVIGFSSQGIQAMTVSSDKVTIAGTMQSKNIISTGPLRVGTDNTDSNKNNIIYFAGVSGDGHITVNNKIKVSTAITERKYKSDSESSELLLFKGNDIDNTIGNRVRIVAAAGILIQSPIGNPSLNYDICDGKISGWDNNTYYDTDASFNTVLHTNLQGKVGIGGIASETDALTVAGTATITGPLKIGTENSMQNTIYFGGTSDDANAIRNEGDMIVLTAITERPYNTSGSSELLLFKGNDIFDAGGAGPDRIRFVSSGGALFQSKIGVFYNISQGTICDADNNQQFNTDASFTTTLDINPNGKVGIGGLANLSYALTVSGDTKINGTLTIGSTQIQPANYMPSGGIIMWSGLTLPTGWVLCDGSNGTPDLRGRFIVGATRNPSGSNYNSKGNTNMGKDMCGVDLTQYNVNASGGEINHTLTIAEMPSHNHSYSDSTVSREDVNGSNFDNQGIDNVFDNTRTTENRGGNQAHNNIPPFYALAFIMKT